MSLLTESDTSPLRGIILGVVIKLVKVISVMLLVGLLVGLIYSKVKDYQKGEKKTDPVIDTATDTVVDTTTDPADPVAADTVAADPVAADPVAADTTTNQATDQPVACIDTAGSWGTCSVSCGTGTQSRTVTVQTPSANGGTPCREPTRDCNIQECPTCTPSICDPNTTAISPSPLCLDDPCTPQECCTAVTPTCTTPAAGDASANGYIMGGSGANIDPVTLSVTGVTCDASLGYQLSGAISVSCPSDGADYTLSGCTKGCLKPVAGNVPEYNLSGAPNWLADETLESPLLPAADCIAGYVGTPVATCNVDNANTIDYYTVDGCTAPAAEPCEDDTTFLIPAWLMPTNVMQAELSCDSIKNTLSTDVARMYPAAEAQLKDIFCLTGAKTDHPGSEHNYGHTTDNPEIGAGDACKATCGTCPDSLPVEPVTQATALPACANIMVPGQVPRAAAAAHMTGMSETECINLCSSQADCGSVSYNSGRSRCYTYNEEYKLTMQGNNYNYYPEKCQPS